jgi:hypothetical protein
MGFIISKFMNKGFEAMFRVIVFLQLLIIFCFNSFSQTIGSAYLFNFPSSTCKAEINFNRKIQNPAQIWEFDSHIISSTVSPSRFGLKELTPAALFYSQPITKELSSAVSVFGLGNKLYNEFSGTIIGAYKFGDYTRLGVAIEYSRISISNYLPQDAYQIHIGGLIDLTDEITAGFTLRNLTRQNYFGGDKTSAQQAIFGLGLIPESNLSFDLDGIISLNKASGLAFAGKYIFEKLIAMRIAYLTNPASFEIGINLIAINTINISLLAQYHNYLGFSQIYSLTYNW